MRAVCTHSAQTQRDYLIGSIRDAIPFEFARILTKPPHTGVTSQVGTGVVTMLALDLRHLTCPWCSDGNEGGMFDEWRFHVVPHLTAVDPRFGKVADDVLRRTQPYLPTVLPPDEEGTQPIRCCSRSS